MQSGIITELVNFLIGQVSSIETQFILRAREAVKKVQELERNLNSTTSIASTEREDIFIKTGVEIDSNPYFQVDDYERLLSCIIAAEAQHTQPELILALWMKEATLQVYTKVVLDGPRKVTTPEEAKSMFIAMNFFKFLGADLFVRYRPTTGGDNILLEEGRFANEHRIILDRANNELMLLGAAKGDYAKAMRNHLTVTGGTTGLPYEVQAQGLYYPAMLSMTHAFFQKIKTETDPLFDEFKFNHPLSDQLTYSIYNGGRGSKAIKKKGSYAMFKSYKRIADEDGKSLENILFQTRIIDKPWRKPRQNAVRFNHYLQSYKPVFTK